MSVNPQALRRERDRFVGFAFSAAELLLEIDSKLTITYAAGALRQMTGLEADRLVRRSLLDLLFEGDRSMVRFALERIGANGRLEPMTVRLGEDRKRAVLGACRLPSSPESVFVTLTRTSVSAHDVAPCGARDPKSGAWETEDFGSVVTGLLGQSEGSQEDNRLTLLQLDGMDSMLARNGRASVAKFMGNAGAYLRARSKGGEAFGKLAENKYGVVHDASVSSKELVDKVTELSRQADPTGIGVSVQQSCVSLAVDGMSAGDIKRVIVYTIRRFEEVGIDGFDISSLREAFDNLVNDTRNRLSSLRQTLSKRDLQMLFQPIVELKSRQVQHYEVLSRFGNGGSPVETINFAEGVGLIEEIDLLVCQNAIEVIRNRHRSGEPLELAVNISGRSLGSDLFLSSLRQLLATLGPLRSMLILEITETSRLQDLVSTRKVLDQLRADGHVICLDDFGAGAASFPYLKQLTVDYVKIDGAYIKEVLSTREDLAIVRAMVSLCNELGVKTVGEMIETEEQAKALLDMGIDLGQGWLFGKPQPQFPTTSVKHDGKDGSDPEWTKIARA